MSAEDQLDSALTASMHIWLHRGRTVAPVRPSPGDVSASANFRDSPEVVGALGAPDPVRYTPLDSAAT